MYFLFLSGRQKQNLSAAQGRMPVESATPFVDIACRGRLSFVSELGIQLIRPDLGSHFPGDGQLGSF